MTRATQYFLADFDPYGPELHSAAQRTLGRPDARADALGRLLERIPAAQPSHIDLDRDWVTIGRSADLTAPQTEQLERALKGLKP